MFGGDSGTTYLNDTWSFDGTTWTQIATQSAPPARAAAQMTYDSVTQKVVTLRRVQRHLLGRHMALGWVHVTVDAGHASRITLLLLPGRCFFPILMAVPIFLADTTATSISLPCGNGTAPIGRSYFHRLFHSLVLQRPLQRIRPQDRLLCLAVSLMLTRITPGPMMARHGLCNLRLYNLS